MSGEKASQSWWPGRPVLHVVKPTTRSVAAAQDSFQRWWASSLSTLAHVKKKCGKLGRRARAWEERFKMEETNQSLELDSVRQRCPRRW